MKNKIAILGLGVLALGVAALSGLATLHLTNYGQEFMANVFDRQTSSPSYGDPWQERYRISKCVLFQEQTKGFGRKATKTITKAKELDCNNIERSMVGQPDGKYYVQTVYENRMPFLFGSIRLADYVILTPAVVTEGVYKCDYDAQGWKTVVTAMPYGRIGITPTSNSVEPNKYDYVTGADTTLIVEEQKGNSTIPHDFYACPVLGRVNGAGVKDGEVRINWGFVSLKNMNMLIIQPNSLSFYDARGEKVKNFVSGDYSLSFPELYQDFAVKMGIKGNVAPKK